jgi:methylase of polypeptide subunit release factors
MSSAELGADVETLDFGGLKISFDHRVLRPRDWTTAQAWWAASLLDSVPEGDVLELCAGAGQIGLLAVASSHRSLVCVDVSPVAIAFTRYNAAAAGIADRVSVREGRISEVLEDGERFPLIVADPPWVPRAGTDRFPDDPPLAIDGGDDGLSVARECVQAIATHLAPGGAALRQLGTTDQATALLAPLEGTGLVHGEVREYGDRGVLLRLDRPHDV